MRATRLTALFLALMVICCLLPALAEESGNLLKNPGFEQLDGQGMPADWYTEAYVNQAGYTTFGVSSDAMEGQTSAMINNIGMNDARFVQQVEVNPSTLYCLSGYIKVDSMADSGRGANLSVENLYVFSESVFEADGQWHYVELYGETGEDQDEVTIFARVGGYSGESQGKAMFDQLSLREVEAVPGDGVADMWFREETPVAVDPIDVDAAAEPFWPWLIVISCAYLLMAILMVSHVTLDRRELKEPQHASWIFWLGMAIAAGARMLVAITVEGYQVDVNCFRSWGNTMRSVGPAQFYQSTSFCDYTPAYIYVMGLSDWLSRIFHGLNVIPAFWHKLAPMLCDLLGAWLITRLAREEKCSRSQAELLGLLVAFNPAMVINSAAWCQIDSVLCLGLLVVAWLAVRQKWTALLPVYVLCALIKPQALMLGPLGLMVLVMACIRDRNAWKQMLKGLGLSAAVALAVVLPFSIHQQPGWLIEKFSTTLASYPYATVNTANFYYLFQGNWASIQLAAGWQPAVCFAVLSLLWSAVLLIRQKDHRFGFIEPIIMAIFAVGYLIMALMGATWSVLGIAAMVQAFLIVLPMMIRSGQVRHVPLLGAVLFLLLYVFGIKMHERYLFPALFLLGYAFVLHRDRRILALLALLSCTMLINEGIVLDNSIRLGSSMGHLNNDTNWLNMMVSVLNVLCALLGVWTAHRVCVEQTPEGLDASPRGLFPLKHYEQPPCNGDTFFADSGLHWKGIDWVLMLAVTAIYAVTCLWNLGSTKAPQDPWTSTAYNESVIIDLGEKHEDFSMLYFCQVSYSDFSVAVSDDGESWSQEYWAEMDQGQCFRWKYLVPSWDKDDGTHGYASARTFADVQKLSGRYVRITAQQINLALNEVIFRDRAGEQISAAVVGARNANPESPLLSDPAKLLNEQDTLEGEPGWYNSTYFDEIYHARTAYEHLNGTQPYETSHPPLGKVIMSWFVGLFGMTPFGWRFAGALAGILMLPAMYVLGKQLTKRTDLAFAAMTMMALDCMHFTQTRIATIDSFPVLFIIVSYLFMLRFMQRDLVAQPLRKLLPDLALSGFFMGCSVASKWIGAYAGIGLALLFFWTCLRHVRLRGNLAWKRVLHLCLWCLLLFVAVPLTIYLVSYIPYFAYTHVDGPMDFLERVWNANFAKGYGMLSYHSTPGLGMDHPFYSPWYEWPLSQRPMYYAMANFVPEGYSYSIFCFGNPAVWFISLAGLAATLFTWIKRHCYTLEGSASAIHLQSDSWSTAPAFVLIGFLAQFLPWVVVPRGTYIYHYFASIPFLILSMVLLFGWIIRRWPRTGRGLLWGYLFICLVFFIICYPYASGVLAPEGWLDFVKNFLKVYYA